VHDLLVALELRIGNLEAEEVWRGQHGVRAGDKCDRAGGVMWTDRHEECLRHAGDLLHLRDAAGADDVRHDVFGKLLLEARPELPAGVQTLADAHWYVRSVAKLAQRIPILGRNRLLEPPDAVWRQAVRQAHRGRDIEAAVGVDEDFDASAHRLSN